MKNSTTFGPIIVQPDYEDDTPFEYHPDLRGLFLETGTEPEESVDLGELWNKAVAFARGIARHHRVEVLLSVAGRGGHFVIRVANHPTTRASVAGATIACVGYEIGGPLGAAFSGGVTHIVMYFLTPPRR